jgi:hypothetical protein
LHGCQIGGSHLLTEALSLGFELGQQNLGRLLQLLGFFRHFLNISDRAGLYKEGQYFDTEQMETRNQTF